MNLKPFLALAALATVTAADTNVGTRTISTVITNFTEVSMPGAIVLPSPLLISNWATDVTLMFSTNRVTNILSILSTLPVPGACPECGAPNHHMSQVRLLSAYDVIYLTAASPGHSNTMQIATGSATNWVSTNLIPRTVQPYASPGAWPPSVPPLNQPTR